MKLDTRDIVALVDRWNGLRLGNADDAAERAEILRRLINTGNNWTTAYNVARFVGYLSGVPSINVFMRMLQSETERQEA